MFRRSSLLGALIATAGMSALASAGPSQVIVVGDEPKAARRTAKRIRATPGYQRRIGHTALDQEALAAAARQRAWRGAKRRANAQATAAGYYFAKGA